MHTCVKFEDFLLMPLAGHVKTLEKSEPNCRFQKSMMILLFQVNGPGGGGRPHRDRVQFNPAVAAITRSPVQRPEERESLCTVHSGFLFEKCNCSIRGCFPPPSSPMLAVISSCVHVLQHILAHYGLNGGTLQLRTFSGSGMGATETTMISTIFSLSL